MRPTRVAALAVLASLALVAAACGGGGAGATEAPATEPPGESPAASAAAIRIEVSLTDALRIEPAAITVPAGQPVTFVITNTGKIEHEFVLGDETVQAEHEEEMAGGHMTEDENAVTVAPGTTKELTVTFDEPGSTLAGCHVTGHYPAGMKATITIE